MATRAEWTKWIEQWKRSGLGAAEFARREGLKPKQFYWWCRQLCAYPPSAAEPRFQPVPAAAVSPSAASSATPAPAWIEIALPNGGVLRVLPRIDAGTLACVVTVAAELSARGVVTAPPGTATQAALRCGRRSQ
jgi:hypothetical protein